MEAAVRNQESVVRPRILVAQDAHAFAPIEQALKDYDLIQATTFYQAKKLVVKNNISLFVIGIHFDDSRCMDLIQLIRKDTAHGTTPIVVVRLLPSPHAGMLRSTLAVMKTVHGITDYIESEGDDLDIEEKIRAAVQEGLLQCQINA
jgi:hypothetical protein